MSSPHRTWLYAHPEEIITDADAHRFFELVVRRAAGEPRNISPQAGIWAEFESHPTS